MARYCIAVCALNIAIIAVFFDQHRHSYLRGEMPVQVAAVIVPVLLVTLLVLVVEWRGVVNAGKIEEESLASVERNHPYLPRLPQRVLTGVLSVVAVVVMIPVITRATASSGELLHIFPVAAPHCSRSRIQARPTKN